MASLVEIKGNDSLQFYDGNKSPSQKKVALGTNRKRVAKKLKRKYEDAYAQVSSLPRPVRSVDREEAERARSIPRCP
jgi:hypothetical protein